MRQSFISDEPVSNSASPYFNNSEFDKEVIVNVGFRPMQAGNADTYCVGGNMVNVNCLSGIDFMPDTQGRNLLPEEKK